MAINYRDLQKVWNQFRSPKGTEPYPSFDDVIKLAQLNYGAEDFENVGYILQGMWSYAILRDASSRDEDWFPTAKFSGIDFSEHASSVLLGVERWGLSDTEGDPDWVRWLWILSYSEPFSRADDPSTPYVLQAAVNIARKSETANQPLEIEDYCRRIVSGMFVWSGKTATLLPASSGEFADAQKQAFRQILLTCLLDLVTQHGELRHWISVLSELLTRESLLKRQPLTWRGKPAIEP